MKRKLSSIIVCFAVFALLPLQTWAAELLIPVGEVIGLQLSSDRVTVVAYDTHLGQNAREAGLKIGDEILTVNGRAVTCAEDVPRGLTEEKAELTIRRQGKELRLSVQTHQTEDGPRLGVCLRQGIAGIGTVTFYDPDTGIFGTLGHGVSDPKGGLLEMTRGYAYEAVLQSVKKGCAGEPGQLRGVAQSGEPLGILLKNTHQGVFGISKGGWKGEPLPMAEYEQITAGTAAIKSTVSEGKPQEYSVEILKIYPKTRPDGRNFLLKVTDPQLLEQTGGVIQGMSGSPIIQNGKIVGAVTHVLVNDPTMGYGIYIGNMLDAAS